jgi:hypothetical protein
VLVLERIADAAAGEEPVEGGGEGRIAEREAHLLGGVDVGAVVDERVARLLLNGLEYLGKRSVAHLDGDAGFGGLRVGLQAEA